MDLFLALFISELEVGWHLRWDRLVQEEHLLHDRKIMIMKQFQSYWIETAQF